MVANSKAPNAPNEAASVGVAKPPKIEPSTNKIRAKGGSKLVNTLLAKPGATGLPILLGMRSGRVMAL